MKLNLTYENPPSSDSDPGPGGDIVIRAGAGHHKITTLWLNDTELDTGYRLSPGENDMDIKIS